MRARRFSVAVATAAVAALAVTACGSSSSGGTTATGGSSSSGGSSTIKLGILADVTGPASSTGIGVKGVQAYIDYINGQGGVNGAKIQTVTADTASNPAGALTGAEKLVQQDHVFGLISLTSSFYGAEAFLLKNKTPVLGTGFDGPEWTVPTNTNLFSMEPTDLTKVYSNLGAILKTQGVTSCGAVGYSDNPSAKASAIAGVKSCQANGLKGGFEDFIKYTDSDYGPIALGLKNAGVDGVYFPINPTSGFPIAATLEGLGYKLKAALFPDGYGGDLLSSPAGLKAAQGFIFTTATVPQEIPTPATQLLTKLLATQGVTVDADYGEAVGYVSAIGFVEGLKVAGTTPTQASFTTALRGVKNFTGGGILTTPVTFSSLSPTQSCSYALKLEGKKFVPLSQKPFCGGVVATIKVG